MCGQANSIAVTHTHARRRQRPPRARYNDTHIVALAQNLDNESTLENKSSAWIEATGLDGLQARMFDLAVKAATSDDAACSMNIVTNDHVCSGPGHHWTNVYIRIGAKDEAAATIKDMPVGMTLHPDVGGSPPQ